MPHTKVFKLIVENVTGKVKMKKADTRKKAHEVDVAIKIPCFKV
jgi:hypothetical protein